MGTPNNKTVAVTWSGGVDSTAIVGNLLNAGYDVVPVSMLMGSNTFMQNERRARDRLSYYFAKVYPDQWRPPHEIDAKWLTMFSADGGKEILRRNKHILDYVMMNFVIPNDWYYVATGSHLGAYPAAVDHLPGGDVDSREMIAYLLQEYGIGYQLLTLLDFGPSRYKTDRIQQMLNNVPIEVARYAYNCLETVVPNVHCGRCYKCVERHAAFMEVAGEDLTEYESDPRKSVMYGGYLQHFAGISPQFSWEEVRSATQGSHREEQA